MKIYQRVISGLLCIIMCLSFSTAFAEENPWMPFPQEEAVDISDLIDGYDKYQTAETTAPPIKTQEDYDAESRAIETTTMPPLSAEMGVITPDAEIQSGTEGEEIEVDTSANQFTSPYHGIASNEQVSTISGDLNYRYPLLSLPGRNGLDLNLALNYNSGSAIIGMSYDYHPTLEDDQEQMAVGWTFAMSKIYLGKGTISYHLADGRSFTDSQAFGKDYKYSLEDVEFIWLSETREFIFKYSDGRVEELDKEGNLKRVTDRFGNTITYTYGEVTIRGDKTLKLPVSITDSVGRVVTLSYQTATTNAITHLSTMTVAVEGQTVQTVNFTLKDYSAATYGETTMDFGTYPVISSVENAVGETTTFTYNHVVLNVYFYYYQTSYMIQALQVMMSNINYPSGGEASYNYSRVTKGGICSYDLGYPSGIHNFGRYIVTSRYTSYGWDASYDYGTYNHSGCANEQLLGDFCKAHIDKYTGYLLDRNFNYHTGNPYTYSTTVTHQNGSKVKYTYNSRHLLIKEEVMNYDEAGEIQLTEWVYDDDNLPIEKRVTIGRLDDTSTLSYLYQKEAWEYDTSANVTRHIALTDVETLNDDLETLSGRRETQSTYLEVDGKYTVFPTSVTALLGTDKQQKVEYTYSADGKQLLTETAYHGSGNSRGNKITYTYDTAYPGNVTGTVTYGAADNKLSETAYTYDNTYHAYVATETAKNVSTYNNSFQTENRNIPTTYTYDTFGRTLTTTQNAMTTTYTYDAAGRILRETYPDNTFTSYTYSILPTQEYHTVTVNNSNQYTQKLYYDGIGQLIKTTEFDENGNEITLETREYSFGKVTKVTDGEGLTVHYEYDALGRVISELQKAGTYSSGVYYTYDDVNRTVKTVDTMGRISVTEYDEDQNPVKTHAYAGGADSSPDEIFTTAYEYDIMGNNTKVTDANGKITTSVYDSKGQLTSVTDALNRTTSYTYDDLGQVLSVTMPGNRTSSYTYDTLGRVIRTVNPGNSISESAYDDSGRVTKSYKDGVTAYYSYKSGTSLVSAVSYSNTSGALTNYYTYDALGNLLTYRQGMDNNTLETYAYYPSGNLKKYTAPDGKSVQYTYNAIGQVTSLTDYFGEVTNYEYDDLGRLYKVLDEDDNRLQFYLYNAMGQVTQSSNNDGSAYSQYTYDELGRLTHKINQKWGTNLGTYDYTYDKVGNILSKTDGTGTTTYVYDNLYRLSSVTEPDTTKTTYSYDPSGNVTYKGIVHPAGYEYTYTVNGEEVSAGNLNIHRETYSYNSRNQLTSMTAGVYSGDKGTIDDTTAYTYDARGNLINASRTGTSDSQVESYAYNLLGNMTSYTKDGTTTCYTYDSSGLRTSKTHNNTTTRYYLSSGMVLNEGTVTADGVTLSATNYIGNEIFGRKNATDTVTSYLLSNGHGDIETVMQNSTPVASYRYDAYGNITAMNETDGFTNPIRYAGEYLDEESGNYYLRARYYNPTLGRFMAEDPAQDGQNWYAYCGGNPVMFVDPSGMVYLIAWSYSRKDVSLYVQYKADNGSAISTDTSTWDDATWTDFTQRNSFARAAYTRKQELIDMGIPESSIDIQRIDNKDDLENTWNMWASYSGVEGLDFYSHGSPTGPEVYKGSGDFWESAVKLDFTESLRSIDGKAVVSQPYAIFYGCNTANGKFAQNYANNQNVTTYAQTNYTNFSRSPNQWIPISEHNKSLGVYLGNYQILVSLGGKEIRGWKIGLKQFNPR